MPIIPLEIPASRAGEADLSLKPAGLKPAASILWISNIDDLLIPGRVVSNQLCHGLALIAADAVGGLLVLLRSHNPVEAGTSLYRRHITYCPRHGSVFGSCSDLLEPALIA